MADNEKQNGRQDHPGDEASQQAQQTIARFINRFSQSAEGYLSLARHAAMPFILTPELLNYIRTEFLSDQVDWVAEADLLLSDLCREIGYEQYTMKPDVRARLIAEAKRELGEPRMEEIARRLLTWVNHLAQTNPRIRPRDLQAQQWGAMVYLKERREEAVREMTSALGKVEAATEAAREDFLDRAEVARVSAVIIDLAHQLDQLKEHRELVEHAALITRLLNGATGAVFNFETVTLDARGEVIEDGRRKGAARQFIEDLGDEVALEMVEIPGGTFLMGTSDEDYEKVRKEYERYWDKESAERWVRSEMPRREVTVSPFFIGKFTVTQKQWRIVAGWGKVARDLESDPSHFKYRKDSDNRPVERVSWDDAKEFCARLVKKTGRLYRLPTEAEWEYACRARTITPFAFGETITHEHVNYNSEYPYAEAKKQKSRGETIPVGSLGVANAFGLFDMHGNVWEWCEDVWHGNHDGAPTNGSAWLSGKDSSLRVVRGGSWADVGFGCRSADRYDYHQVVRYGSFGFRVVVAAWTS